VAPLVAPMLDVSVVGLLVAVRQLILHGISGRQLVAARLLMLVCAVVTWALNIAQSVLDHRWGAAVMDSVAPGLLLGWAEVGPALLRLAAVPPQAEAHQRARTAPEASRSRLRHGEPSVGAGRPSLSPPPEVPRVAPTLEEPVPDQSELEDDDPYDLDPSGSNRRAA